jgi:transcriptional regulator with XRE-family HTH domain
MSLIENIKQLCKNKGTSIPKLEKEFGFGHGSIYNWEKNSPSVDKLRKVAKYFNVTLDSLLVEKTYIEEIKDMDEETLKMIKDPKSKPYIYWAKKAMENEVPDEVFETLVKASIKLNKK